MFHLTREVRFALNGSSDPQFGGAPTNSFGGFPSLTGIHPQLALQITLEGELGSRTGYLRNIKEIDDVVRKQIITKIYDLIGAPHAIPAHLIDLLCDAWPGARLARINLQLSPFLSVACFAQEHPMVRLSQTFEFCASHRLHNPALSEDENRTLFGKCNNPFGHGHNYIVKITLRGQPGSNGTLINLPTFERIVGQHVIDRFDHKNLNLELNEFKELIPSVENIAMVIYRALKPQFPDPARLAGVTVWETPKTWCEYAEE